MLKSLWVAPALALMLAPAVTFAGVTDDEAERLEEDGDLTPWGATRAGNTDGSIPAWEGGLKQVPDCYEGEGSWYCDPFPPDEPKFVITAENVERYRDMLSEGQQKMFELHPETYKMPVFETRRTFANPEWIYEASRGGSVTTWRK